MSLPFDPFYIQHYDLTAWIFWLLLYLAILGTIEFIWKLWKSREKEY
jgi:hypothetical protein